MIKKLPNFCFRVYYSCFRHTGLTLKTGKEIVKSADPFWNTEKLTNNEKCRPRCRSACANCAG